MIPSKAFLPQTIKEYPEAISWVYLYKFIERINYFTVIFELFNIVIGRFT